MQSPADKVIVTERLELRPATPEQIEAALTGPDALAESLGVIVPPTWPPDFLDEDALRFLLDGRRRGPEQAGWWFYFVVLREVNPALPTLIGSAGFKGPPSEDGTVEIGYGIVSDQRRRGYASESARALVAAAFASESVVRVIAETYPELVGSVGVLRKCGFTLIGEGSEPGVIRFALSRADYKESRRPSA